MNKSIRTTVFVLGLFASTVCSAHGGGGWHGGGWHGGGWHGGGWHGGGWHGSAWHGGGWYGGGWGPRVIVGAPYYGSYYPACQRVRVCNGHGHCWLRNSCY